RVAAIAASASVAAVAQTSCPMPASISVSSMAIKASSSTTSTRSAFINLDAHPSGSGTSVISHGTQRLGLGPIGSKQDWPHDVDTNNYQYKTHGRGNMPYIYYDLSSGQK